VEFFGLIRFERTFPLMGVLFSSHSAVRRILYRASAGSEADGSAELARLGLPETPYSLASRIGI